ncbi:MAG: hypothetical protein ACT4OZ_01750 [Gemmatimonadota bacterium]
MSTASKLRASALVFCLIGATPGDSSVVPVDRSAERTDALSCLICVWESGPPSLHALVAESGGQCNTPEEREVNNCVACGGESECHEDPQPGFCHVECVPALEEDLVAAYLANDATALSEAATAINSDPDERGRVEFNLGREVLQVINCRGIVSRQVPMSRALLSEVVALQNQH